MLSTCSTRIALSYPFPPHRSAIRLREKNLQLQSTITDRKSAMATKYETSATSRHRVLFCTSATRLSSCKTASRWKTLASLWFIQTMSLLHPPETAGSTSARKGDLLRWHHFKETLWKKTLQWGLHQQRLPTSTDSQVRLSALERDLTRVCVAWSGAWMIVWSPSNFRRSPRLSE